jgi:hypothetical protein
MNDAKKTFLKSAFHEIKSKGVRRNTHAAVSASNPRRQVPRKQMIAIALSKARKAGYK